MYFFCSNITRHKPKSWWLIKNTNVQGKKPKQTGDAGHAQWVREQQEQSKNLLNLKQ